MKALYAKTPTGFAPADEAAERYHKRFAVGDRVMLEFRRPRSIEQHRLYWALVQVALDNTDAFASREECSDSIKMACGYVNTVHIKHKGEWYERKTPKSIAFESCDQDEFNDFFNAALDYLCTELIPGLDPVTLRIELAA